MDKPEDKKKPEGMDFGFVLWAIWNMVFSVSLNPSSCFFGRSKCTGQRFVAIIVLTGGTGEWLIGLCVYSFLCSGARYRIGLQV